MSTDSLSVQPVVQSAMGVCKVPYDDSRRVEFKMALNNLIAGLCGILPLNNPSASAFDLTCIDY